VRLGGNSIYENEGLGIVLGPNRAIYPNGGGPPFPVITSIVPNATTTTISGYYHRVFRTFRATIDFYSSPACSKKRPWHFDEGKTYLGGLTADADGVGNLSFAWDAPVVLTDEVVTATATPRQCVPTCSPISEGL